MTTLYDYVEIVRESRERTNSVFPLPDVDSCIDYAITEAGEYLDAVLREKRDTDKRNRDKDHDARKEWGQCGYMIASALIQIDVEEWNGDSIVLIAANFLAHDCIAGLCEFRTHTSFWILGETEPRTAYMKEAFDLHDALVAWVALCRRYGWEPAALLRETCAAFERKHLPVVRGYDFELVSKAE